MPFRGPPGRSINRPYRSMQPEAEMPSNDQQQPVANEEYACSLLGDNLHGTVNDDPVRNDDTTSLTTMAQIGSTTIHLRGNIVFLR